MRIQRRICLMMALTVSADAVAYGQETLIRSDLPHGRPERWLIGEGENALPMLPSTQRLDELPDQVDSPSLAGSGILDDPLGGGGWSYPFRTELESERLPEFHEVFPSIATWQPTPPLTLGDVATAQWMGLCEDYRQFYSSRNLWQLLGGFAVGGAMANTGFDEHFVRHSYLETIGIESDEWRELLHEPRFLGDGHYTLPLVAVLALSEPWLRDLPLGKPTAEWSQRTLRTFLVGEPILIGTQLLTGGSRPGESEHESHWKPFRDDNGVSGHGFVGAIPILSAAQMVENPWIRGSLYVASALPALSRVNDDDHYFSQAFLGWWIAYLSARAVDRTFRQNANTAIQTWVYPNQGGISWGMEVRY